MRNRMKELRNEYRITQVDAARRAGIDRTQWAQYESGKHIPSVEVAIRIARVFVLPVEQVFKLN